MTENIKPNLIKKLKSSRIFIAIFFTLIGIGVTSIAHSFAKENKDIFEETLSFHDAVLREMMETEKRMNRIFFEQQKTFEKAFSENEKKSHNTKVVSNQDEENYYYELYFSGFKKDEIVVAIKDSNLNFSANQSDKKSQSNFYYSFFTPNYDKTKAPEITREENRILVKLAKKK